MEQEFKKNWGMERDTSCYFINENGEKIPAPLVANVTEYGRSNSPYPKKPFLRRSFKKSEIEKAMQAVQDKYIPKG